jgi:hypothetical protein
MRRRLANGVVSRHREARALDKAQPTKHSRVPGRLMLALVPGGLLRLATAHPQHPYSVRIAGRKPKRLTL